MQAGLEPGEEAEFLDEIAAAPSFADEHMPGVDDRQPAATKGGAVDVYGGNAEQRPVHAEHGDALTPPQFGFRVAALDVEEFVGQRPDLIPLPGRDFGGRRDNRLDARQPGSPSWMQILRMSPIAAG